MAACEFARDLLLGYNCPVLRLEDSQSTEGENYGKAEV
jgi:hypothetical protein